MKVLFTGATGVLGRAALPELVAAGHDVTAVVRPGSDTRPLERMSVQSATVDLFDPAAVAAAVDGHEAVIHFATSIPPAAAMTRRKAWLVNDRLRAEATRHLVDAALVGDVEVFVQQAVSFVYADGGDGWLDEDAPIAPVWDVLDSALEAERQVARIAAAGGRGVALRLARLYGPGPVSDGYLDGVAAGKIPLVGRGDNFVSHLHVEDAGSAVSAALGSPSGVYNVVEETPVTVAEEMDLLARLLGVAPARRIPAALARLAAGRASRLFTVSHRVSADRFRAATGWRPRYRSVHEGWPEVVTARRQAA